MAGHEWQVGDLALCVGRMLIRETGERSQMKPGFIGTVNQMTSITHRVEPVVMLIFEEFPGHQFDAEAFRYIPPHQADEDDAETIRLFNASPAEVTSLLFRERVGKALNLYVPQAPGAGHPASLASLAKARARGRACGPGGPMVRAVGTRHIAMSAEDVKRLLATMSEPAAPQGRRPVRSACARISRDRMGLRKDKNA